MIEELLDTLIKKTERAVKDAVKGNTIKPALIQSVPDKTLSYSHRFRKEWHKPEYDFNKLQIVQDQEGYVFRTIKKKVDRFILDGFSFVSENPEVLEYIERRIKFIELATDRTFKEQLKLTAQDLIRYSNCMWYCARDRKKSLGNPYEWKGKKFEPFCGFFIIPFERLEFKEHENQIIEVRELMPDGQYRDYKKDNLIHFYDNKKPGFIVGTPELYPAIEDIEAFREIEENVLELIHTNLYPRFHFRIGTDAMPASFVRGNGESEVDYVRKTVQYMPPNSVYVSDHRQQIEAVGAENKALRIDFYLSHFKSRVLSAIGTSPIDMGEVGTATKSTASTLSKSMMMDVEALQLVIKDFVDHYVINPLLLEGGYNILDPVNKVEIQFGTIDKEEKMAIENQVSQLYTNNLLTYNEARIEMGRRPLREEEYQELHYSMFKEPDKMLAQGPAYMQGLVQAPTSSVTPEIAKNIQSMSKQIEAEKRAIRSNSNGTTANKARPSNQHGSRLSPKLNRDFNFSEYGIDEIVTLDVDFEIDKNAVDKWQLEVVQRYYLLKGSIALQTIAMNMLPKLNK